MVLRLNLQFEVLSICQVQLISIHFMDNFTSVGSYGFHKSVPRNKIFRFKLVTALVLTP